MDIRALLQDIKCKRNKKVILDTDAFNEIDDQYVIAYCALCDSLRLHSVNAAHFAHNEGDSRKEGMEKSYDEIIKVLSLCKEDHGIPVFKGCYETFDSSDTTPESEAVDNIVRTCLESEETVYVLTIGAATNVAAALVKEPKIKEKICVVWLALAQLSVEDPVDYNFEQDFRAGEILLESRVPLVIVPAAWVTSVLRSDIENTRTLYGYNKVSDYLGEITEARYNMVGKPEGWARTIWDIGAIAVIDVPEACVFDVIKAPRLNAEHRYEFDDSRHEIIMVNGIERDPVFDRVWKVIRGQ